MAQPTNLRDAALKDIDAARPVTPEALLHRAQARALLYLADRVDVLIDVLISFKDENNQKTDPKPPADTSWLHE